MFAGIRQLGRDTIDDLFDRGVERLHGDQKEKQHRRRQLDRGRDIHRAVGN